MWQNLQHDILTVFAEHARPMRTWEAAGFNVIVRSELGNHGNHPPKPFKDQHGAKYFSIRDAAERLGIAYAMVGRVLRGEKKSTHGYVFAYL